MNDERQHSTVNASGQGRRKTDSGKISCCYSLLTFYHVVLSTVVSVSICAARHLLRSLLHLIAPPPLDLNRLQEDLVLGLQQLLLPRARRWLHHRPGRSHLDLIRRTTPHSSVHHRSSSQPLLHPFHHLSGRVADNKRQPRHRERKDTHHDLPKRLSTQFSCKLLCSDLCFRRKAP